MIRAYFVADFLNGDTGGVLEQKIGGKFVENN